MNTYETAQRKRNITVGTFVLIAVAAFIWLLFKFGDLPIALSKFRAFPVTIQFATAPGVQRDTPVRFCGYQVGRVIKVFPPEILKDLNTDKRYHQSAVIVSIDKQYLNSIPTDIQAKLMTRGLGSSYIELKLKEYDIKAEAEYIGSGSRLQGSSGVTSEFFPEESQAKLDDLANNIKTLVQHSNEILGSAENKQNFKELLANLSKASAQANVTLKKIEELSTAGIEFAEQLSNTSVKLAGVLEKVDTGDGTVARLINDGKLYESLLESVEQIHILAEELKFFVEKSQQKGMPIKLK